MSEIFLQFVRSTAIASLTLQHILMIFIGCLLIYLGVAKRYEPLLLVPIGFGAVLVNIPLAGLTEPGGLLTYFYFGIETGLEYRRTHFAATIGGWGEYADAQLFDANTTLDGYVAYPFNEFVRLVAQVSTAAVRDENGEIVYDDNGNPRMAPTVAIQTQIGF